MNEVQATLDWATIRSPIDGTVVDKKVDVGDMVTPGQMLATLYDPTRMQLVASVHESLTHRLQVGQDVSVRIEGLDKQCRGTVSEIVPEAQSASRTFQVKVTGPCPPASTRACSADPDPVAGRAGPGRATPRGAEGRPTRVGAGGARRPSGGRAIRTGRTLGEDVEVLSGLPKGNRSYWSQPQTTGEGAHMTDHSRVPPPAEHGFTNRIVKLFLESNLSIMLILLATAWAWPPWA